MGYAMAARTQGGPEVIHRIEIGEITPAAGEVVIEHQAIGINFIDIYIRTGAYPWPVDENLILGSEGAGIVTIVGEGVIDIVLDEKNPETSTKRIGVERIHVEQDFVEPSKIGFGRAQFLFGILAPDMKAGDARRFLQHGAALLRARGDDGGDPPLADQRRTVRTGRGVGEDQRDILGPDILAIGAIGAARAALDPARDVQFPISADVHRVEQLSLFLDGEQGDFGKVAPGPAGCAGEDHILHARAAHRFGAGFAHDPADRFQQVGLAAAIGADDAGQSRLDPQFGGVDEALEAG